MSRTERAKYPTDLTDDQWRILRKLLPQPSRLGAPQTICRRAVVNAIVVHPADIQDYDEALLVLGALGKLKSRFHRLKVIFADSAYGRNNLPESVRTPFGWLLPIVLRPVNTKRFVVLPKRWIVERTFGWLGRYRRYSNDYDRNAASSEAMIYIAMSHMMLRRLADRKNVIHRHPLSPLS